MEHLLLLHSRGDVLQRLPGSGLMLQAAVTCFWVLSHCHPDLQSAKQDLKSESVSVVRQENLNTELASTSVRGHERKHDGQADKPKTSTCKIYTSSWKQDRRRILAQDIYDVH